MLKWERLRVVHGPVVLDGFIARAIEAFTAQGGHLKSAEVWCGHCWDSGVDGPGYNAILGAAEAPLELLRNAGVPAEQFPLGYDPLASCKVCQENVTLKVSDRP
jgi:hypothetical protein